MRKFISAKLADNIVLGIYGLEEVIYPNQIQGNKEIWTLEEAENTLLEFTDRLIKAMNSMILRSVDLRRYFSGYRLRGVV
ncbi:MAG: hypothetical protein K6T71_01300 [Candidatus Bipolaricaulota bacterium]|nr:hypothetical protein [Candidatus Bipolaricaulota bacterium]